MKLTSFWLAGVLASIVLAASPARADIVPEPATGCVDGSFGATCHAGQYCALDLCTTDADCEGGEVCNDRELCTATIDCGGGGGPFPTTEVTGDCGEACPDGSACTPQKVCVSPSTGTTTVSSTGGAGGPAVGGAGGSGGGGGQSAGGAGGDGTEVVVTGCACTLDRRGRALGAASALLFAAGLAGLARRRKRSR